MWANHTEGYPPECLYRKRSPESLNVRLE
ncbi:MAG: hypothetical protein K0S58_2766, partial [Nitrospira sp.]|nr:hypothetical protein [Nitrospira sp.]